MFQDFKGKVVRKRCKLRATLSKRGRKRGVFGFLRGRPWASRVFELTSTYTTSTLRYFKDDECRGSFDLIGCTAAAVAPSLADGRPHAFEVRLASRERFLAAADNAADAARWVQALEASGIVPLSTDRLAETLSIDVLGEDRENVAYRFLLGKSARDDVRRQTHGEIDAAALAALELELEEAFPKVRGGAELALSSLSNNHTTHSTHTPSHQPPPSPCPRSRPPPPRSAWETKTHGQRRS